MEQRIYLFQWGKVILLSPLLLFAHLTFAYPSQTTWLDPTFVERAFLDVALKNEYRPGDKPLTKWQAPIRIWVDHRVADHVLHDELTNAHLSDLSAMTGHDIRRVSRREDANVVWIFTRQSQWQDEIAEEIGLFALEHIKGAICKASFSYTSSSVIDKGVVIIPVDQARSHGKLLACIVEEITQVLGLPNDAESAYPSIFNDETPEDLLSPLDVILLKLLYEPELRPGMSREQAAPVVRKLLQRYQKQGILRDAAKQAKNNQLFKLVGGY
ncbi:DUF2927 domain-containing protein [Vibrio cholerae]